MKKKKPQQLFKKLILSKQTVRWKENYWVALKIAKTCFHKLCSRQELAEEHRVTWQSRKAPAWVFPGKTNSVCGGVGNGEASKLCQDPRSANTELTKASNSHNTMRVILLSLIYLTMAIFINTLYYSNIALLSPYCKLLALFIQSPMSSFRMAFLTFFFFFFFLGEQIIILSDRNSIKNPSKGWLQILMLWISTHSRSKKITTPWCIPFIITLLI